MNDIQNMEEHLEYVQVLYDTSQAVLDFFQQNNKDSFTKQTIEIMTFWIIQIQESNDILADYIQTVQPDKLSNEELQMFSQINEYADMNIHTKESLENIFHTVRPLDDLESTLVIAKERMDKVLDEKIKEEADNVWNINLPPS